eukprot:CAMPEP_0172649778 /NCGR_PEP_ID=MMETSP1068-20121228/241962_1 /TAXON_ID=35684 /ORGANISM="Pseudopedinella elastica, Strain CCMP716" /LENGTH=162 /DNA_ID=CAMNT_0013464137 /DNA_START=309 /DNA_END=796 /DNA_ORIENTATION=+
MAGRATAPDVSTGEGRRDPSVKLNRREPAPLDRRLELSGAAAAAQPARRKDARPEKTARPPPWRTAAAARAIAAALLARGNMARPPRSPRDRPLSAGSRVDEHRSFPDRQEFDAAPTRPPLAFIIAPRAVVFLPINRIVKFVLTINGLAENRGERCSQVNPS